MVAQGAGTQVDLEFTPKAPPPPPPLPPRLEATYEIREDISDVLGRVGAFTADDDSVKFAGWARMALPTRSVKVTEVRKPNVGENKPAAVGGGGRGPKGGLRCAREAASKAVSYTLSHLFRTSFAPPPTVNHPRIGSECSRCAPPHLLPPPPHLPPPPR